MSRRVTPNSLRAARLDFDPKETARRARLHVNRLPTARPTQEHASLQKKYVRFAVNAIIDALVAHYGRYEAYNILYSAQPKT